MPETQSNAGRLRNAYAQWEATKGASGELLVELLADDVSLSTAFDPEEAFPMAKHRIGKEHARDYLVSLALNLEMIEFPTLAVVEQGEWVVWIGHCAWRDRRSRREMHTPKVDVWRFRDGKAISVIEMFDTLGFARFMGAKVD